MRDKVVSKENFMLKYCLNRYEAQDRCDKAVNACLPALKFVPDWIFTNKMLQKLDDLVFSNYDIVFVNPDSDVSFFSDDAGLVNAGCNNASLEDVNFDYDDPETIIHFSCMNWCNRYKQCKARKKKISND